MSSPSLHGSDGRAQSDLRVKLNCYQKQNNQQQQLLLRTPTTQGATDRPSIQHHKQRWSKQPDRLGSKHNSTGLINVSYGAKSSSQTQTLSALVQQQTTEPKKDMKQKEDIFSRLSKAAIKPPLEQRRSLKNLQQHLQVRQNQSPLKQAQQVTSMPNSILNSAQKKYSKTNRPRNTVAFKPLETTSLDQQYEDEDDDKKSSSLVLFSGQQDDHQGYKEEKRGRTFKVEVFSPSADSYTLLPSVEESRRSLQHNAMFSHLALKQSVRAQIDQVTESAESITHNGSLTKIDRKGAAMSSVFESQDTSQQSKQASSPNISFKDQTSQLNMHRRNMSLQAVYQSTSLQQQLKLSMVENDKRNGPLRSSTYLSHEFSRATEHLPHYKIARNLHSDWDDLAVRSELKEKSNESSPVQIDLSDNNISVRSSDLDTQDGEDQVAQLPEKKVDFKQTIERKFTKMMEKNKKQTQEGELTQHGYLKRHSRLLKDMQNALESADLQQRKKQYKKEKDQQKRQFTQFKSMQTIKETTEQPEHQQQQDHLTKQYTKKLTQRKQTQKNILEQIIPTHQTSTPINQILRDLNSNKTSQNQLLHPSQHSSSLKQYTSLQSPFSSKPTLKTVQSTPQQTVTVLRKKLTLKKAKTKFKQSKTMMNADLVQDQSINEQDHLKRGVTYLTLLSQDLQEMKKSQKRKKMAAFRQRQTSVPIASILEDLTENGLNFNLPDSKQQHRASIPSTRWKQQSQPHQIQRSDKNRKIAQPSDQETNINLQLTDGTTDFNANHRDNKHRNQQLNQSQKVLKLANQTTKQNKFMTKLTNKFLSADLGNNDDDEFISGDNPIQSVDDLDQLANKNQVKGVPQSARAAPRLININMSQSTDLSVSQMDSHHLNQGGAQRYRQKNQIILHSTLAKQSAGKQSYQQHKQSIVTFEKQLRKVAITDGKSESINRKILDMIASPQSSQLPDYAKASLQAVQTEIKTQLHDLKSFMSPENAMITLDSVLPPNATTEIVKNENIELVPRLPIQCKVSVKERVAPLELTFQFFDLISGERVKNPDAQIYVSPTETFPNAQNCSMQKSEFQDPRLYVHSQLKGKVIPEKYPYQRDQKFPQQVYLSLLSMAGCKCTITVRFPQEKKAMMIKIARQPTVRLKQQATKKLSRQKEHWQELIDLDQDPKLRFDYFAKYNLKKKFIKEEVDRCATLEGYKPEVMLRADNFKVKHAKERLKFRQQLEKKRRYLETCQSAEEDGEGSQKPPRMITTLMDDESITTNQLNKSSDTDIDTRKKDQRSPILMIRCQKPQNENAKYSSATRRHFRLEKLKDQNAKKMNSAKAAREKSIEVRQKHCELLVVKQQILSVYKKKKFEEKHEELRQQSVVDAWLRQALVWIMLKKASVNYEHYKKKKIAANRRIEAAFKLVRLAHRFFSNRPPSNWGKTIEQRTQTKISTSLLHLTALRRNYAVTESRKTVTNFLTVISTRMSLKMHIVRFCKATKLIQQSWKQCQMGYLTRLFILQGHFMTSLRLNQEPLAILRNKAMYFEYDHIAEMYNSERKEERERIAKDRNQSLILYKRVAVDPEHDGGQKSSKRDFVRITLNRFTDFIEQPISDIIFENCKPFAKMIRLEGIIRNIKLMLETETLQATRQLEELECQIEQIRERESIFQFSATEEDFQSGEEEESNDICSSKSGNIQELESLKQETIDKLTKLNTWQRSSKYLKRAEAEFKQVTEQICSSPQTLSSDFARKTWKRMQVNLQSVTLSEFLIQTTNQAFDRKSTRRTVRRTESITMPSTAKQHPAQSTKHKPSITKLIQERLKQAELARATFKGWLDKRRHAFNKSINKQAESALDAQQLQVEHCYSGLSILRDSDIKFTKLDRCVEPEELTFLFMKTIHDIAVELKIDQKMKLQKKENHEKSRQIHQQLSSLVQN